MHFFIELINMCVLMKVLIRVEEGDKWIISY